MDFFEIAKQGSIEEWQTQLEEGQSPNIHDTFGTTPLSWIFKMDRLDLFVFAIQHGADPCFPYQNQGNVFFDILTKNSNKFLNCLYDVSEHWIQSPNLLSPDRSGNLLFHRSVSEGFERLWEILKKKLNSDILRKRNEEGRTLFLEAIVESNETIAIEILTFDSTVILDTDTENKNFLHLAAERNLDSIIESVIDCANINGKSLEVHNLLELEDVAGNTPLFLSASADATESLFLLLNLDANPFIYGENNESITRLLDREKFSHTFKIWKQFVIKKLLLGEEYPKQSLAVQFIKSEKPFKPEELAQAKRLDLV